MKTELKVNLENLQKDFQCKLFSEFAKLDYLAHSSQKQTWFGNLTHYQELHFLCLNSYNLTLIVHIASRQDRHKAKV